MIGAAIFILLLNGGIVSTHDTMKDCRTALTLQRDGWAKEYKSEYTRTTKLRWGATWVYQEWIHVETGPNGEKRELPGRDLLQWRCQELR